MLDRSNVPLAPLTTFGLGGPAQRLLTAYDEAGVLEAVQLAPEAFVLGGGSNVVLPDDGLAEVILVRTHGLSASQADCRVRLEVAAGEDWDGLVAMTVADGLVGLEALSGIPGTVGASPVQNIGAYGSEVADTIAEVRALDRTSGRVATLSPADCGFAYRHSSFKAEPGRWVVLTVTFSLADRGSPPPVRYRELARTLGVEVGDGAPAAEIREAVLSLRRAKGMVVDSADPDSRSAGSFFTNPILRPEQVPAGAPAWPEADGRVKTSAAWLIEQSGFSRGWGDGPVGLSGKHPLAIVHRGGGSSAQVVEVARVLRDGVRRAFGVELTAEPVIVSSSISGSGEPGERSRPPA